MMHAGQADDPGIFSRGKGARAGELDMKQGFMAQIFGVQHAGVESGFGWPGKAQGLGADSRRDRKAIWGIRYKLRINRRQLRHHLPVDDQTPYPLVLA